MSTDPHPDQRPAGAHAGPADRPGEDQAPRGSAARRPRAASSAVARVLTVVYAVVVAPIATALIAYGGTRWLRYVSERWTEFSVGEFLDSPGAAPIVLGLVVGLLLLISVVATGFASSAGMLAVGLLGVVSIVLSLVPELLLAVQREVPPMIPQDVLDGLLHGLPLVLHTLIGGLGLALAVARRRPDPPLSAAVAGIVAVPVVLLAGMVLLLGGAAIGAAPTGGTSPAEVVPAAVALVLAGALLVWVGAAASRWSPYGLIVPALLLLAASLMILSPATASMVPAWLSDSRVGTAAMTFLTVGGGVAAALVLLFDLVVLLLVRGRARRRLRAAHG